MTNRRKRLLRMAAVLTVLGQAPPQGNMQVPQQDPIQDDTQVPPMFCDFFVTREFFI